MTAAAKQGVGGFGSPRQQPPAMGGQRTQSGGKQAFFDAVYTVYRQGNENGMNYSHALQRLNLMGEPSNEASLRRAVDELVVEGRLYTTSDDTMHAAT